MDSSHALILRIEITFDDKIIGKRSNRQRQIDISLRFRHAYYNYLAIIECKDDTVSIDMVDSFKTKIEDVGAHRGIVVTSMGYQAGAIEAAKAYGIELFKLSEESTDWIVKIREDVHEIPFPTHIAFDHPPVQQDQQNKTSSSVVWQDILFIHKNGYRTNLWEIITDTCEWAHQNKLDLPCIIDLRFGQGMSFSMTSTMSTIPIFGIRMTLTKWHVRYRWKVDLPPKPEKYIYSDIKGVEKYRVDISDVLKATAKYDGNNDQSKE